MDLELGRIRRECGATLDQLAQAAGVPLEDLQEWERQARVPRKHAAQVKWGVWALHRDAALAKSGLPECDVIAALPVDDVDAMHEHVNHCELCGRRSSYVHEHVGPMPPMNGSAFMRALALVDGLSGWRQSSAAGALVVLGMGGMGVVVLLGVAIVGRSLTALIGAGAGLLLLLFSGAVGGLVHHITAPIRSRGALGYYGSWVLTTYGYLAAVFAALALAAVFVGWDTFGPETRDMMTTPAGLLLSLGLGAFFGVVVGRTAK